MRKSITGAIVFLLSLANSPIYAGSVNENELENKPDTIQSMRLNEVVISSPSKETNDLKTLPGSVSVFTSGNLDQLKVISVKDLSMMIPNFFIPDYGSRLSTPVYIRGIGERSTGQSIGLYVDNMPHLDKSTFDFDLTDIQRVEVLRGPQGTLYGRNAMGGIINIYTFSPLEYEKTKLTLTGGNHGLFRANGSVSRKLSNNVGLSVGGYYDRNDGFFTNQYTGEKADHLDAAGGRFRLDWKITDNLKAEWTGNYHYSDQGAFPYGVSENGKISAPNYNSPGSYRREMAGTGLNLEYKNEHIILNSSTNYQFFRDDMKMDLDYATVNRFTMNQKQRDNTFSEELAIRSNHENNYQWSFGIYGFTGNLHTDALTTMGRNGIEDILQPIFDNLPSNAPRMTILNEEIPMPGKFKNPAYGGAIFHQSTYNNLFVEGLSITAGVRADYEKTKLDYDMSMAMDLNVQMGPRPIPMSLDTTLLGSESISFTEFLPKVALKYELDDRRYIYASASNGYKTGGYNIQMFADLIREAIMAGRPGSAPSEDAVPIKDAVSYKPEYSWNYEIGFKGEIVRDFLYGEIAAYFIDVKDMQLTQFVNSGQGRMISNAGHATSKGIDLSLTAHLFEGFNVNVNYGYTHAIFKDYKSDDIDYSGKYVPFAPGNTLSVNAVYDKRFQNKFIDRFSILGQYNAAGRIYWTDANDAYQDFYGTLNLRGSVAKDIFELAVWTRNTLDTEYTAFYFETKESGNPLGQRGKPFMIGVDLSVLF